MVLNTGIIDKYLLLLHDGKVRSTYTVAREAARAAGVGVSTILSRFGGAWGGWRV